jgi:hypothetical protein
VGATTLTLAPALATAFVTVLTTSPSDPLAIRIPTEPAPPATVEIRVNTGVFAPTSHKILAVVYFASDPVSSKNPCTPVPRACTTLSGMRS